MLDDSSLHNTDVEVFIVLANRNITEKNRFSASDFISKWRGCVKGMENVYDEELDSIKHDTRNWTCQQACTHDSINLQFEEIYEIHQ